MKRYLKGVAIGMIIMLVSLAIIISFSEYERLSFMIISFMSGMIGQFLVD